MAEKLKPCPFCGGIARHLPFKAGFHAETAICDTCHVSAHVAVWNKRAQHAGEAVAILSVLKTRVNVVPCSSAAELTQGRYKLYAAPQPADKRVGGNDE